MPYESLPGALRLGGTAVRFVPFCCCCCFSGVSPAAAAADWGEGAMRILPKTTSSSELSDSSLLFFVPLGLIGESSSLSNSRRRPEAPTGAPEAAGADAVAVRIGAAAEPVLSVLAPVPSLFVAGCVRDAGGGGGPPGGAPDAVGAAAGASAASPAAGAAGGAPAVVLADCC